jgi:GAF domain-containing protein
MSPERPDVVAELASAFSELGTIIFEQQPLSDVLTRTVELTKTFVPVPAEVSITLIAGDDATTPAATDPVALKLDETQYATGHGPCLAAAQAGHAIAIADTASDTRWPDFARDAHEHSVRSSLSVPLPVQRQVIGALNMYTREQFSADEPTVRLADQFATYAAAAIANTTLYMTAAQLAHQMLEAMESRATIEQAKGILMARHRCDPGAAFDLLVRASQEGHLKLREVATRIVDATVKE